MPQWYGPGWVKRPRGAHRTPHACRLGGARGVPPVRDSGLCRHAAPPRGRDQPRRTRTDPELWLRGNRLTALPDSVRQLHGLRELELRENEFGEVPEALRGLPALRRLDLRSNRLRKLPSWLAAELPALEKLDLRWNDAEVPPELGRDLSARGCVVLR